MPSRGAKGRRPSGDEGPFDPLKWWLRSRDGIDDAIDRDVERSCSRKDGYRTEDEARAVAAMNGLARELFTYHCRYCDNWHLTRRPTKPPP